jgi:hypothetical protein
LMHAAAESDDIKAITNAVSSRSSTVHLMSRDDFHFLARVLRLVVSPE